MNKKSRLHKILNEVGNELFIEAIRPSSLLSFSTL